MYEQSYRSLSLLIELNLYELGVFQCHKNTGFKLSKINDIKFQIGIHVYICTGFVNGSTIRRLTMRVKATLLALPNY